MLALDAAGYSNAGRRAHFAILLGRYAASGPRARSSQSPRGRCESQNKGRQTRTLAKGLRNMVEGRHMNLLCQRHRDGRQRSNTALERTREG
jgi:hypothetical protein